VLTWACALPPASSRRSLRSSNSRCSSARCFSTSINNNDDNDNAIVDGRLRPQCAQSTTSVLPRSVSPTEKNCRNLDRYACRVLLPLANTQHDAPYGHNVKTRRHPRNRKYITYLNAAVRGDRATCAENSRFSRYVSEQTNRHTHGNTSYPSRGGGEMTITTSCC